ncbi:MAG: 2Fe-2S iron-sulfur cluster-binding protein [Methanosarcina sp.]
MIRFKIDNIECEAPEGSTILSAASSAGLSIPTLCHGEGLPHYSSCMVCMVKDARKGSFIPSCSALVQEGMDIDASGQDVISMRKRSIELLLSEHRAECEAPCRVVCPAGYNIPRMNRLIAARDFEGSYMLVKEETEGSDLKCINCSAYCENACRRKKVDVPVSIRNIKLFIYNKMINPFGTEQEKPGDEIPGSETLKNKKIARKFSSRLGKIEASELQEWLKECQDAERMKEITVIDDAYNETQSCMHCDCRAADNCRLRELSSLFRIKDSGEKKIVNTPITKKINHSTGLIFENAKCIKCGLCVRVCEDSVEEPALCFINRGFISIISEPLTSEFDDILATKTDKVVNICPTGALAKRTKRSG